MANISKKPFVFEEMCLEYILLFFLQIKKYKPDFDIKGPLYGIMQSGNNRLKYYIILKT